MMTHRCWARIIPVLWFSLVPAAAAAPAASLDTLGRAYLAKPTPANRAPLAAFAKTHARDRDGALALLALAAADVDNGRADAALINLQAARPKLAALEDYTAHYIARALLALERGGEALPELDKVIAAKPASPLRAASVILSASLLSDRENPAADPARAVALVRRWLPELPQPRGFALYGAALEASGEAAAAAIQFQKVWHDYPLSAEAAAAGEALSRLERALGTGYPPAMADALLRRASRLIDGRQTARALSELNHLLNDLAGPDRDLARVRIGAAHYAANSNLQAFQYLSSLSVAAPEADAERLYYHVAAARRLDREDDMRAALEALAERHPTSPWRLEALTSAGNYYLLKNRAADYEPVYRACADAFPTAPESAYCHWKVAWVHYLQRRATADGILREHLRRYPSSTNAPSALYFLGRLAEASSDRGEARALYEQIVNRFPGYFYAMLARERLSEASLRAVPASQSALSFLRTVQFTPPPPAGGFEPDAATRARIERARLLAAAGLDQLAENELRFAARTDSRPHAVALELAQLATRRGAPDTGLRYVKSLAPRYLNWSLQDAPPAFWKFAYPLPYRDSFEKHSRANSLDAFLVAGLVRQESEFNPRAVSRAKAVGLTQILPRTGRQISRNLRIGYRSSLLYNPDSNLRMGTWHLRKMIDSLNGDMVAALAAYNAGKSRADAWLTWGDFREPAEFIETIPFTETRDYVQIVLRNADMYRRLYGASAAGVRSSGGSSHSQATGGSGAGQRRARSLP